METCVTSGEGTSSFLGRIIIVNEENGGFQTLKEEPKDEYYLCKAAGRIFNPLHKSLTLNYISFFSGHVLHISVLHLLDFLGNISIFKP